MKVDFAPLLQWIQTHPGVFAAMVGMALVSSYLLLMLVTRLGDIKPSLQTFALSAVIHLVLAMFWGTIAVPLKPGAVGTQAEIIPIRQVIVENSDAVEQPGEGTGTDAAVWDRLTSSQTDVFTRIDPQPDATLPTHTEAPDRTPEVIDSLKASLPALPRPSGTAVASPQPITVTDPMPRDAAGDFVDIGEETAQARPEVGLGGGTPQRQMAPRKGSVAADFQRESRPAPETQSNVTVQLPSRPSVNQDLIGDTGAELRQPEGKTGKRSAAPATNTSGVDDTGLADGGTGTAKDATSGAGPSGTQPGSKFSRTGSPTGRSDVAGGSLERTGRPSERGDGNVLKSAAMASLNAAGTRSGLSTTERPGVGRPNFGAIPSRESAKGPATYRLRNLPRRQKVAVQLGATQESERAVELSLRWLAAHQNPEGNWDSDEFDAHCPAADRCWGKGGRGSPEEAGRINNPADRLALQSSGQHADSGLTALVILAYLGAGYTHEEGQYADQVDRALRWLIRNQQANGFLGGDASHYERMYCHGMATYALGEASGMMTDPASDPQLRAALLKAVKYIVAMQNPGDGGWRYIDGHLAKQEGDMSMFGWQLMALKSSQIAGIEIPEQTQQGMVKFLKRMSLGERKGLASYRFGEAPKASMTAEALFSRQMLGVKRDNPSSLEAVEYLTKHPPRQTEQDLYYWYYGTLAMYQYGGEPWKKWNDQLRDTLVTTQRKTAHAAGSWDPRDNWSQHGGRIYSTALSTLCLEVYYRFLPLYQLNSSTMDALE